MRRATLACTWAMWGCFSEAAPLEGRTSGTEESSTAEVGASGTEESSEGGASTGSSGMSEGATTGAEASEASTGVDSSTGTTDTTTTADESTSTGAVSTWCDEQPGSVLACYDFDGAVPLLGAATFEEHGTVAVSDEQSTSPPQSLRVEVVPAAEGPSNASIGRTLAGATLPFDGVLATRVWIDPVCHAGFGQGIERLLLALQFYDDGFLLNLTVWLTADDVKLYESDQPQGFPSEPHQLAVAVPAGVWVDVALAYAADGDVVTLTIDGAAFPVQLGLVTAELGQAIATVTPTIVVGTTMAPDQPGCTMYFDDVIASE